MTRDEIRGIVEGITDEQLKKILDINSADIGKAKQGVAELKESLENAEKALGSLEAEAEELRKSQREAEEIKKERDMLQKAADQRAAEDRESALKSRFDAAAGDAEFLNGFTRDGIFGKFSQALEMAENQGKSDAEIFGEIIGDGENIFASKADAPMVVASTLGFGGELTDGDVREIMGLS